MDFQTIEKDVAIQPSQDPTPQFNGGRLILFALLLLAAASLAKAFYEPSVRTIDVQTPQTFLEEEPQEEVRPDECEILKFAFVEALISLAATVKVFAAEDLIQGQAMNAATAAARSYCARCPKKAKAFFSALGYPNLCEDSDEDIAIALHELARLLNKGKAALGPLF